MHKHADLSHSANQNRVQRKPEKCRTDEKETMKERSERGREEGGVLFWINLMQCGDGPGHGRGGGGSRSRRFAFSRESKA